MANLRTNNLSGEQGQNAYRGSVFFSRGTASAQSDSLEFSGIAIGTSDFTIEGWLYKTKTGDYPVIFDTRESGNADGGGFFFGTDSSNYLYFYTQSTNAIKQTVITNFSWYHFALVRTGGTTTLYLNGQVSGTYSDSNNYSNDITKLGTSQQYTGGVQNNWNWGGYLSNIRIVVGSAVYTSAFIPPTSELKAIPNTKLLCCQNSDDPTQEETGRTITANGSTSLVNRTDNLIKNGRFTASATENWTLSGGSAVLGTGQSGTFNDGNHVVLTASSSYAYLYQAFTTVIGRTYRVNAQSNGADQTFISTSTSESDAIITDIRSSTQTTDGRVAEKSFIATRTTYYVILRGGTGAGNFDTVSVYEQENRVPPKVIPPYGVDAGNTFGGPIQQSTQGYMYFPTGRTEERGRGRGLFNGGGGPINTIQYIQIQSSGNSQDFGDLVSARDLIGSTASSVRGLSAGAGTPARLNTIDFVTIATTSNAIDFGDLITATFTPGALASDTRAVWGGGSAASPIGTTDDTIQFATIATTGNTQDFGNLTVGRRHVGGLSSPTRGVYGAGASPGVTNVMDFITIASTGNATDFGDMTETKNDTAGCSNAIRGLFIGGTSPGGLNTIEFITIATAGDGTDFGDLIGAIRYGAGLSDSTRGVFVGGGSPGTSARNTIDFVTIETLGNSQDFGDLFTAVYYPSACSDSHGGLS